MLRQLNHALISFIAFSIGINYCLFTWLNYDIMSANGEFMSSARYVWGIVQSILGGLLILLFLFNKRIYVFSKYWTVLLGVVFAIQLPIASLWYMSMMREPLQALLGVVIHTLLIALIAIDYLTSHKHSYSEKSSELQKDQPSHIKLDT